MKFVNPQYLNYLFIALAGMAVLYFYASKRRAACLKKIAAPYLLPKLTASFSRRRQNIKSAMIVIAVLLGIVALCRPQWGFHWEEVSYQGVDIFVAVDVSKSMLTEDVLPNRLARAKLAVEDLVNKLRGDRIGLIAFAGSAFVQCPLTVDYDGFLLAIEDLDTSVIPRGGTNLESAIDTALESFAAGSEGADRALIIITDGESHEGDALSAAERAKKENIKIYSIGVGTMEGELIQIADEQGNKSFIKDKEGQVVKSRLNEQVLKDIALKSDGTYIKSTATQFGLDLIYEQKIAQMQKKEAKTNREKHFEERFQIPLAIALLLIFVEPVIANQRKQL